MAGQAPGAALECGTGQSRSTSMQSGAVLRQDIASQPASLGKKEKDGFLGRNAEKMMGWCRVTCNFGAQIARTASTRPETSQPLVLSLWAFTQAAAAAAFLTMHAQVSRARHFALAAKGECMSTLEDLDLATLQKGSASHFSVLAPSISSTISAPLFSAVDIFTQQASTCCHPTSSERL